MAASEFEPSSLHVVIFPWLAMGHLLPCLELAERLAARGHRVSFIFTPRNLASLPPVRRNLAGLSDGAESTGDLPPDKSDLHRAAFDGLAAPFAAFLNAACASGRRPDWIVADFVHHRIAASAQDRKVPCTMLLPCAAGVAALAGSSSESMDAAPRFEAELTKATFAREDASGAFVMGRFFMTLKTSKLIVLQSSPGLDPDAFPLLTRLYGKPAVPRSLFPPPPDRARSASKNAEDDASITWLCGAHGRAPARGGAVRSSGERSGARRRGRVLGAMKEKRGPGGAPKSPPAGFPSPVPSLAAATGRDRVKPGRCRRRRGPLCLLVQQFFAGGHGCSEVWCGGDGAPQRGALRRFKAAADRPRGNLWMAAHRRPRFPVAGGLAIWCVAAAKDGGGVTGSVRGGAAGSMPMHGP
ncbi:UDP-glycosyltransferase 91C1-like [Triticum urartu]|uniref:UDP-glycosyltransferase 91C1-like n=1 Tax=Triticum urartu TaxID=4572 RepID=UPI00204453E9|nr:UDP-glycosyltransferase 91C1-like [Triticum urartu]